MDRMRDTGTYLLCSHYTCTHNTDVNYEENLQTTVYSVDFAPSEMIFSSFHLLESPYSSNCHREFA